MKKDRIREKILKELDDKKYNSEHIADLILNYDPTLSKKYSIWMIQKYIKCDISLEDFPEISVALNKYERLKRKQLLNVTEKDIYQIDNIITFVEKFDDSLLLSKSEAESWLIEHNEVEIIYNNDDFKVVIPHNAVAAAYYSKNTKWCTKDIASFEKYNKKGKLHIILDKKKNKRYQFHFECREYNDDRNIEINMTLFVKSHINLIKAIMNYYGFMPLLSKDFEFWSKYVFDISQKQLKEIIKTDHKAFKYIKNPDTTDILNVLKQSTEYFHEIANPTDEMKLLVIKNNPSIIQYIDNPTEEMQLISVKSSSYNIQHINNPSEIIQLVAVEEYNRAIQYIDNPTESVQMCAISEHYCNIELIKNPCKKAQMTVAKYQPYNLRYVKTKLNIDVQRYLVETKLESLYYIKNPDSEIAKMAVERYGRNIDYVSDPSNELKWLALKNDLLAINVIEDPTKDMLEYVLRIDHTLISMDTLTDPYLIQLKIESEQREQEFIKQVFKDVNDKHGDKNGL